MYKSIEFIKTTRKETEIFLKAAFPEYKGHKIRYAFVEEVTLCQLNPDSSARNFYRFLDIRSIAGFETNPLWVQEEEKEGLTVQLPFASVIVCLEQRGDNYSVAIYAHPSMRPR